MASTVLPSHLAVDAGGRGRGHYTALGGPERVIDETGDKIREDFLSFLQRCRDAGNGSIAMLSSTPTSEMLTATAGSEPPLLTLSEAMPIYVQQLHEMRSEGQTTLYVDFAHLMRYDEVLATAILENFYRFEPFLKQALKAFVEAYIPSYARISATNQSRDFWISFYNLDVVNRYVCLAQHCVHRLRELTATRIGQLMAISGTVTRTSEIRPELLVGVFRCDECYAVVRDVEQQFRYTEPPVCLTERCNNRSKWTLVPEQSTFVSWQRIRVQESANEIPAGSMPRCIDVVARNELVERAKAGDKCTFTGCLIAIPDVSQLALPGNRLEAAADSGRSRSNPSGDGVTGLKALGVRDLTYKLAFLACMVQSATSASASGMVNIRAGEEDEVEDDSDEPVDPRTLFTSAELDEIAHIRATPQLYQRLVESVAPSIYGHAEIKAGILLMLFGGIHKVTPEGINLRGDINICIVGDPGTAKSQFLRYVIGFLPRSVYTGGKSSSAAGLTASVIKDEETGDFTIEAGALMLADNGICAIDEFDKMDMHDQVAIHEAMEQQTISISKAGIQATLNARTSILAAANPIGGRYDRRKTLRQNISMTAPIMSRFDLFFVVLDECDEQTDHAIAAHILALHRYRDEATAPMFAPDQLQRYIRYARTIKPRIARPAADLLVEKYRQLRQSDATGAGSSYRMTVRQLESMIRLSEALARLHLDDEIGVDYVREACRLLKSSVIRVETDNINLEDANREWTHAAQSLGKPPAGPIDGDAQVHDAPQKLSLKFDEYMRISNVLVHLLRRHESATSRDDADGSALGDELGGMTKAALIEGYLETIERDIDSEATLNAKQREVSAIIDRLIHRDCVLIEVAGEGSEPVIVVHPNYVPA